MSRLGKTLLCTHRNTHNHVFGSNITRQNILQLYQNIFFVTSYYVTRLFLHRINYQICHTKSSSYENHIKLYVSSMKKLIPRKRFTEKFTANLNMIIYSLIFYIISILISSFCSCFNADHSI